MPGQVNVGFTTDFAVGVLKDPSKQENAIGVGEMAFFTFLGDFDPVHAALHGGTLRLGIHVQSIGIEEEGSAAFVTHGPYNGVPEPSTFILLLSSAGLFIGAATFRKKS